MAGKFLIPLLLKKVSLVQAAIAGMAAMALGALTLWYFVWSGGGLAWLLISAACVNGIGIAVGFTTFTVLSVEPVAEEHHGLLSSVATTAYFFGGGLGLSLLSLCIQPGADGRGSVGSYAVLLREGYALPGLGWLMYHAGRTAKRAHSVV